MDPILPLPIREDSKLNGIDDLELTEEENSDMENHNLIQFGKNMINDSQEVDINDL